MSRAGGGDLWPVTSVTAWTQGDAWLMSPQRTKQRQLTQNICGSVSGDEARVVPVAHAFLQDAFPEVLPEAAARRHQAVVAAVRLRESADDSSGHQSPVRQHGQHPPPRTGTPPS